jgi:hypothetical protein
MAGVTVLILLVAALGVGSFATASADCALPFASKQAGPVALDLTVIDPATCTVQATLTMATIGSASLSGPAKFLLVYYDAGGRLGTCDGFTPLAKIESYSTDTTGSVGVEFLGSTGAFAAGAIGNGGSGAPVYRGFVGPYGTPIGVGIMSTTACSPTNPAPQEPATVKAWTHCTPTTLESAWTDATATSPFTGQKMTYSSHNGVAWGRGPHGDCLGA